MENNKMKALIAEARAKFALLGFIPQALTLQLLTLGVNVERLENNLQAEGA